MKVLSVAPLAAVFLVLTIGFPFSSSALAAGAEAPSATALGEPKPALEIREDAVASSPVVGLGRDVVVAGEVRADVAALNGSVELTGSVRGDVIVLGGDARLGAEARVEGGVFVLGGRALLEPGAAVTGRTVAYPDASRALMTLIEGPSFGLSPTSSIVLATKTALLTAWLALVLLLLATSGARVLETAVAVRDEPLQSLFTGLTGILALVMTALFIGSLTGPLIALPLLILVVLFLLMIKIWGMVAVFCALGAWISRRLGRRDPPILAATAGLLALGLLKFLPYVGGWGWMIATLIGAGAALGTKFGLREPWLTGA